MSEADDWYFTAPSRRSYFMQGAVFAGVMADAAMVDSVIALDHIRTAGRGRAECVFVLFGPCVCAWVPRCVCVRSVCCVVVSLCRAFAFGPF